MMNFVKKLLERLSSLLLVACLIAGLVNSAAGARYISPDDWNPTVSGVGTNRYAYSENDPINNSDPNGHQDANETNIDPKSGEQKDNMEDPYVAGRNKWAGAVYNRDEDTLDGMTFGRLRELQLREQFGDPFDKTPNSDVQDYSKLNSTNFSYANGAIAGGLVGTGFVKSRDPNSRTNTTVEKQEVVGKKISNDDLKAPPAKRGLAPIGSDGYPVELHHRGQNPNGPLDEMTRTEHRLNGNFSRNHSNTGQQPSEINRPASALERRNHWGRDWDFGRFRGMRGDTK